MKYILSKIPIGARSVIAGAHAFWLHPFFVLAAWIELYGIPIDPRIYISIFLHDIGYVFCRDIDGTEGERHPELAARIMGRLFGKEWHDLCLYHSRHYAKMAGAKPSRLCFADKLSFCYQIKPLYLFMTMLTGELEEYLGNAKYWNKGEYVNADKQIPASVWYDDLVVWIKKYIEKHKDGAEDLVTVDRRVSATKY
jgi:hypothetical protein